MQLIVVVTLMAKTGKSGSSGSLSGYAVGYGKPPAKNQFRKGQSGNPHGGSKKRRARKAQVNSSSVDHIIVQEANRKIQINENGVPSLITIFEAAMRKMGISAAKGDRAAQKQLFGELQAAIERQHKDRMTRFGLLVQYEKERLAARTLGSSSGASLIWPDPADLVIDYENCAGEVVGPVDAQQAEPFFALLAQYRIWQARLARLQIMATQATGHMQSSYPTPISVIGELLDDIRHHLPPSFKARLEWDDEPVPENALEVDGLHGEEKVDFGLLPPESNEMAYALYGLVGGALSASAQVRRLAKLDIVANTKSLVNRLQAERANSDGGTPPPIAAPEFGQFYEGFATGPGDNTEEPAQ